MTACLICTGVFAVGVSSLRADGFVYKTSCSLTNPFVIVANEANQYLGQSGNFHVPTIDGTKFVVTNAIFKLNGALAGAVWGGGPGDQLSGSIQTSVQVYSLSESHSVPSAPGANSLGFSVRYASTVIDALQTNYFLSGSPLDQGGYVNVPASYDVNVEGSFTDPKKEDPVYGGIFAFIESFELDVELDLQAISIDASTNDLPPSTPPPSPTPMLEFDLGDLALPLPPIAGTPAYVQSALGMQVNSVQVQGNDIHIIIQTSAGKTNYVQASSALNDGFSDISGPIVASGTNQIVSTEFVDTGAATNAPARFYRVRLVP